jgi:ankyrin repeat protein
MKKSTVFACLAILLWGAAASVRAANTTQDFWIAVYSCDLPKVRMYVSKNPKLVNAREDQKGSTPLHIAVEKNSLELAKFFLAKGASVNAGSTAVNNTPLHDASALGFYDMAVLLIANKANVNARNKGDWTPLHLACVGGGGQYQLAQLLISKGAKVNVKGKDGKTPLSLAQENRNAYMIQLLQKNGAK